MPSLFKHSNAHHKAYATEQSSDLPHTLPEVGLLEQLRDDGDGCNVDKPTAGEGQDPSNAISIYTIVCISLIINTLQNV